MHIAVPVLAIGDPSARDEQKKRGDALPARDYRLSTILKSHFESAVNGNRLDFDDAWYGRVKNTVPWGNNQAPGHVKVVYGRKSGQG